MLVGSLQYLTLTRPDLTYQVNQVSQFMQKPRSAHMTTAKRILRYVKANLMNALHFTKSHMNKLIGYCDSDFSRDPNDRKSKTCIYIFLGNNLIMWSSRKQATLSRSSAKSKYRSIGYATVDIRWCSFLCRDLNFFFSLPLLYSDNASVIFLASNSMTRSRSQHINTDYYYVREIVQRGALILRHVSSLDQLSDIFTKASGIDMILELTRKIRVCSCSIINVGKV